MSDEGERNKEATRREEGEDKWRKEEGLRIEE